MWGCVVTVLCLFLGVAACVDESSSSPGGADVAPREPALEPSAPGKVPEKGPEKTLFQDAGCGSKACDAYEACCKALSGMEVMETLSASCGLIQQMRSMPNADEACIQAMTPIKAMKNAPQACR